MKLKKTLTLVLAVILIVSLTIVGTLAFLTAQTDPVTNVFQISGDGVTLDPDTPIEPNWPDDPDDPSDDVYIEAGKIIPKDPQLVVTGDECYVYFKVEEENNYVTVGSETIQIVEWATRNGWTPFTPTGDTDDNNVYYFYWETTVSGDSNPNTVYLFTDNDANNAGGTNGDVKVTTDLDNDVLAAIKAQGNVELTVTGYAVQESAGANAVEAFNNALANSDITL